MYNRTLTVLLTRTLYFAVWAAEVRSNYSFAVVATDSVAVARYLVAGDTSTAVD